MKMPMHLIWLMLLLTACSPATEATIQKTGSPTQPGVTEISATQPVQSTSTTVTTLPSETPALDPANWKAWPVLPLVNANIKGIYQRGQELGNNPQAFSIFGDCQSQPEFFLGLYETDATLLQSLSPELQEMVTWFGGSFNRKSPTIKDGTTAGGLLAPFWHNGTFGCGITESPVDCELRLHNPSFVFINVGTHWVVRNQEYLRTIITELIGRGIVPILVTKADEREQGEKTNSDLAILAEEFNIPLWNFYAAVSDLPDLGLYAKPGQGGLGNVYLGDIATERYRLGGLQSLYTVWQAVITP